MTIEQAMAKLQYLSYRVTLENGEELIIIEKSDVFDVLEKVAESRSANRGNEQSMTPDTCDDIFVTRYTWLRKADLDFAIALQEENRLEAVKWLCEIAKPHSLTPLKTAIEILNAYR